MNCKYTTKRGLYYWLFAVVLGGIFVTSACVAMIKNNQIIYAIILVIGYVVLLYIGGNNGIDIFLNKEEVVFKRYTDCKLMNETRIKINEYRNIGFDEDGDAAFVELKNGEMVMLGIDIVAGKKLQKIINGCLNLG